MSQPPASRVPLGALDAALDELQGFRWQAVEIE